jgi:ferric-dicitrate binding protein FerR (iron transport regulator)
MVRTFLGWVILAGVSIWLPASDSGGAAMLYTNGAVWLNGGAAPHSSAIFPGDMLQTQRGSAATINSAGSSVLVSTNSVVKLEQKGVALEHGSVSVATSKALPVHAGQVTIVPSSPAPTQFEVADLGDQVRVFARKGDVSVIGESGTTTVAQGQQTTVAQNPPDDRKTEHKQQKSQSGTPTAPIAGRGAILDSFPFVVGGGIVVGGIATWALVQGSNPLSPWKP